MTTLTLADLTKSFTPGVEAVAGLDLDLEEGELMVLLGPSGCGKTTTLRLIAGLDRPTRGDVLLDGRSISSVPPEKRGIAMVFQDSSLFPFMTAGENVAFGLKMRKLPRQAVAERVSRALQAVRLAGFERRRVEQLSGGERQRVALARALVIRPKVLLLDEPLSNLDRGLREGLRTMILELQREAGITSLFVTHDQNEAVELADRIALMMDGKLRQVGRPRDFFDRPADAEVARFFGTSNFIRGFKSGASVETALGALEVNQPGRADGPVLLTIRAEAIEIGANGHNNFAGTVLSSRYSGATSQCRVGINGTELEVATPPYKNLGAGDEIVLHLPRERIWLLSSAEGPQ